MITTLIPRFWIHRAAVPELTIGGDCEGIWVGAFRREHPCRNPATRKVNAEWLCTEHAEDIPTPDQMDYRDCADCRADRDMEHRPGAPGCYYWCPGCNTEWRELGRRPDDPRPDDPRPDFLGFVLIGLWVIYALGSYLILSAYGALWLEPGFYGATDDDQAQAMMSGLGLALIPWLACMYLTNQILYWGAYALGSAARYVLGGPIVEGGPPR